MTDTRRPGCGNAGPGLRWMDGCMVTGRSGEIRTPDPLLPKQVRYQAALRSARPLSRGLWDALAPVFAPVASEGAL